MHIKDGFETLYFSEKGYVLRHKQEGYFQLGFFSFILAMEPEEFHSLCKVVTEKSMETDGQDFHEYVRNCIVPTPFNGMQMALTKNELDELHFILEKACDEGKALGMINLFNT